MNRAWAYTTGIVKVGQSGPPICASSQEAKLVIGNKPVQTTNQRNNNRFITGDINIPLSGVVESTAMNVGKIFILHP